MRGALRAVVILAAAVLLPSLATAQGTLTGTVRDQSGSVLPGVTVEASSPALIEKVRSAVTDSAGQYRIPGLNPGTYSLTFRLSGFTTVTRTAIELSGSSTLTIPVDLRVGSLTETLTVTGETPVVDVQSTQRETVLSAEVIAATPGLRTVGTLLNAVPGLVVNDGALALSPTMTFFAARGGPINEGRMAINGMTIAAPFNGGGVSTYILDSINTDEISVTVAGGLGESDIGGPMMNLVPRSGGNSFRGQGFINNAGDWSRGDNLNATLTAPPPGPNLKETPGIINAYDASASYGGPIMRDRLWFFGSYRSLETAAAVPGVVANANAFNASRWDWIADPTVTARTLQGRESYIGRITMQVSAKHRVSYNQEYQRRCEGSTLKLDSDNGCNTRGADWVALGAGSTAPSPEANPSYFGNLPYHVNQAIWTAPMTNKLLLEAGFTRFMFRGGTTGRPAPDGIINLIPVTEQSTANRCAVATGVPLPVGCTSTTDVLPWAPRANFAYRGVATANPNYANPNNWRASASYVTGSHEMKVGYQGSYIRVKNWFLVNEQQLAYRFNQGVPNQITWRLPEWHQSDRTATSSIYVQDKWTRGRLTLQGALRYDRAWSFTPADHNGTPFVSAFNAEPISFPRTKGVDSFNDITPRMGVAYDLFGNGRTALKFNIGHYLDSATNDGEYTSNSPAARIVRTGTRNWNDRTFLVGDPRRDNKVVDCDIMNFAANQECLAVTGDSQNFGKVSGNITEVNQSTLHGWNVRQSDWQWGVTVQQELLPRMSVEVAYNRRWFLGAKVTDNTLRGPEDYQEFTITAPVDPRLPGGGGYPITMSLVTQAASDRGVKNYVTFEQDFGPERDLHWDGVDITLNARLRQGLMLQIGTQTGRTSEDTCDTEKNIDTGGLIKDLRSCRDVDPFQTTVRGLASYTVPRVDVLVSGTVRSQPALERSATWAFPNALIETALGRLPPGSNASGTTTANILDADHRLFAERRTQIDMRIAKIFRFAGRRADIGIDLSNLLNTNYATTYENAYQFSNGNTLLGGTWGNPTAIYTPRFVRWNLTVDF